MRSTALYFFAASLLVAVFSQFACTTYDAESTAMPSEISQKLHIQEEAWNAGNIDQFMSQAYWENDSLMFIGSQGLTFGYNQTLANYHKSYPSAEAMGQLTFDVLQWRPLGKSHGLLIGAWHLERGGEHSNLHGHFSLTWAYLNNDWVIIADHSS